MVALLLIRLLITGYATMTSLTKVGPGVAIAVPAVVGVGGYLCQFTGVEPELLLHTKDNLIRTTKGTKPT